MSKPAAVRYIVLAVLVMCTAALHAQETQATATLNVHMDKVKGKVSPTLYGLMTEEINYSYDGGLYGELVRNRTFHPGWDQPAHWTLLEYGTARASMELDKLTGPSPKRQLSLKLTVQQADSSNRAGVENPGYWGIPVRADTTYRASFYAKSDSANQGPVAVSIINDDTGKAVATGSAQALTTEWKQFSVNLTTGTVKSSAANHLVLTVAHPGVAWFDVVSLFPPTYKRRLNGNRIDLMEKLAALKPAFLRLPGGNYLEGDHINQRFEWKDTIGPIVNRPTHLGPWGYQSSDGMGLLEFLEWCEDLHMRPVLAVYAGYSLQQEHVSPGSDLEPYVQDALEELQYVTGDASTGWGAVRAKDGHPEPFPLDYVEIGNEDSFDKSGSYDGRFAQFFDAIRKTYPQLKLIATAPVQSRAADVVDDHYYKRAAEFFAMIHHYDDADRNGPKVFVGEWATREGTPTPNFGAALGDAAWMTSMERNSDLIVMASYAPLFVNVNPGGMQWDTDLIGYDALTSYGSPSYYAQVMFSNHIGTEILDASLNDGGPRLFYSATENNNTGTLYLKIVNASSTSQALEVKLAGATAVARTGKLITLRAQTMAETNTNEEPTKILPVETFFSDVERSFRRTFPPYSITVVELHAK